MRALVTGATGFVGSHLVRALLASGWEVRALLRPDSSGAPLCGLNGQVEWVAGDLCDAAAMRRALQGCQGLFHAAAYYSLWAADPDEYYRSNVLGTRRVLEAARDVGVERVVYTSSVSCVGEATPPQLADEDSPIRPGDLIGPYKQSKWQAEQVALELAESGLDVVVVLPSSAIGPGDAKPTPTGGIVLDFLTGRMPAYVDTGLNFVDVRDVAAGHLLAWERGRSGRRYVLGNDDNNLTLLEFLERVGRVCGREPPRLRLPYGVAWLAGAVSTLWSDHVSGQPPRVPLAGVRMARQRMFCSSARAIAELGLPQTPLDETLRDAVAWFRTRFALPLTP